MSKHLSMLQTNCLSGCLVESVFLEQSCPHLYDSSHQATHKRQELLRRDCGSGGMQLGGSDDDIIKCTTAAAADRTLKPNNQCRGDGRVAEDKSLPPESEGKDTKKGTSLSHLFSSFLFLAFLFITILIFLTITVHLWRERERW